MTAYEGLLNDGVYPGYFLFFTLEPHTIDINIHPTKTEVKFENEQSLYAILRSAVKHSLGLFQIAPTLDFDRDPNLDVPYQQKDQSTKAPKIEVDRNFNPFSSGSTQAFSSKASGQWESLYQEIGSTESEATTLPLHPEIALSEQVQNWQRFFNWWTVTWWAQPVQLCC